jgi:hypothetical protein
MFQLIAQSTSCVICAHSLIFRFAACALVTLLATFAVYLVYVVMH